MAKKQYYYGEFKVVTNIDKNLKKFEKLRNTLYDPSGKLTKALYDIKGRAPGRVADAVRNVYNIEKSDIMPKKKKIKKNESAKKLKRAGYISLKGTTISELTLHYEGRALTPLHFYFDPLTLPQRENHEDAIKYNVQVSPFIWRAVNKPIPYKMTTEIKKGGNKTLKSPNKNKQIPFVAPARKGNSRIIPWLRNPDKTIEPFKTLSLPQMVDNEQARKIMNQSLGELYNERLHHHVGDLWDKCCSEN